MLLSDFFYAPPLERMYSQNLLKKYDMENIRISHPDIFRLFTVSSLFKFNYIQPNIMFSSPLPSS